MTAAACEGTIVAAEAKVDELLRRCVGGRTVFPTGEVTDMLLDIKLVLRPTAPSPR